MECLQIGSVGKFRASIMLSMLIEHCWEFHREDSSTSVSKSALLGSKRVSNISKYMLKPFKAWLPELNLIVMWLLSLVILFLLLETHPMHPGRARRTFLEHSHLQLQRQWRHSSSRLHKDGKNRPPFLLFKHTPVPRTQNTSQVTN